MNTIDVEKLKQEWFIRFEKILLGKHSVPQSGMKCLELCEARCCPRVGMRNMPPEQVASPLVVLLPFEMEFLIEKTGVDRSIFRLWPIDLTPEIRLEIGMLDLGKPCPFLTDKLACSIHEHNPLDCRTFPLLPTRDPEGELVWDVGEECPSLAFMSPKFAHRMKTIWHDLDPFLPRAWWDLYEFADHWTGWPPAEDTQHAN